LRRLNERLLPGHMVLGPRHVILGVNNYCNLHCRMCDVGTGHEGTNFGANLLGAKTANMPGGLLPANNCWCGGLDGPPQFFQQPTHGR